jgi:hypothetical protein
MFELNCSVVNTTKIPTGIRVLLHVDKVNTNDAFPIPANIEIEGDMEINRISRITVRYGQTMPTVADPKPERAPLYPDKLTSICGGVTLHFVRAQGLPNQNCYNVFFGDLPVGFIWYPLNAERELWKGKLSLQHETLDRFESDNLTRLRHQFCERIASLLTE